MLFKASFAVLGLVGIGFASFIPEVLGEEFHETLLRRQAPGTPAYACHNVCGNSITLSRAACYCGDETFRESYAECLICSGPDNQNIWRYYGGSLTTAASACGLPVTPISGSTSTQTYDVTTTILGTSGINTCATSSTSSTIVITSTSSSIVSATTSSATTIPSASSASTPNTPSTTTSSSVSVVASSNIKSSTSTPVAAPGSSIASSGTISGSTSSSSSSGGSTVTTPAPTSTAASSTTPSPTNAFYLVVQVPTASRNKRQTNSIYIGPGGIITQDITKAFQFSISAENLYSNEGQFSTSGLTPYAAFAPTAPVGSVTTRFTATTTLTWSNSAFSNGVATYCMLGSVIQFVFTAAPAGCIPITLAVRLVGLTSTVGLTSSTTIPYQSANSTISGYTTSTVYTTKAYTITSCAATVINCPVGSVTTEVLTYVTVCPVTTIAVVPGSPSTIVKTMDTTKYYTVTACAAADNSCRVGAITKSVGTYTTTVLVSPGNAGVVTTTVPANGKSTATGIAVFTGAAATTTYSIIQVMACAVLAMLVLVL